MTNKVATEQQAFEIGGAGSPRTNRCVTGEVAINLGCTYPDSYTSSQLIKLDDLDKADKTLKFMFNAINEIKTGRAQDTLPTGKYNTFTIPGNNNGQLLYKTDDIIMHEDIIYMKENGGYYAETAFSDSAAAIFDSQSMNYQIGITLPEDNKYFSANEIKSSRFEFTLVPSSRMDTFEVTGQVNLVRGTYECTWKYYEEGNSSPTQTGTYFGNPIVNITSHGNGEIGTVNLGRGAVFEVPIENSYALSYLSLNASVVVFARCTLISQPLS